MKRSGSQGWMHDAGRDRAVTGNRLIAEDSEHLLSLFGLAEVSSMVTMCSCKAYVK